MKSFDDVCIFRLSWDGGPILEVRASGGGLRVVHSDRDYAPDYLDAAAMLLAFYAHERRGKTGLTSGKLPMTEAHRHYALKLLEVCAPVIDRERGRQGKPEFGGGQPMRSNWCEKCQLYHVVGVSVCPHRQAEGQAHDTL